LYRWKNRWFTPWSRLFRYVTEAREPVPKVYCTLPLKVYASDQASGRRAPSEYRVKAGIATCAESETGLPGSSGTVA
jgi:hypothetical protein